jgi:putative membrane protein
MSSSVMRGAAVGAMAGLAGSAAMVAFNHLLGAAGFGDEDRGAHHEHRRNEAKPNDTDGTISDEPASIKIARLAGERVKGAALTERERSVAGSVVHHAFGAFAGALYGAAAAKAPALGSGLGLAYGAAVWLAADEAALPLLGLAKKPSEYPAQRHAAALATHLVFGLTVEAVRRMMAQPSSPVHT